MHQFISILFSDLVFLKLVGRCKQR